MARAFKIEPLNNYEIQDLAIKLKIPFFSGVYVKDELLKKKKQQIECFVLNHETSKSNGSHWTALAKNNNIAYYFDSFGNLSPPKEVLTYLGKKTQLYYNVNRYQEYESVICGHLAIKFLRDFWLKNIKNI